MVHAVPQGLLQPRRDARLAHQPGGRHANWNTATGSAPVAAYAVVPAWIENFREDVKAFRAAGKPSLILNGTADNILPIDVTCRPFHQSFPEADYVEIDGAPHGLLWTHAAEVNEALLRSVKD